MPKPRSCLLAAAWGDPFSWRKAVYTYQGHEVSGRTSLDAVALAHRALRRCCSLYVLVLVADTLLTRVAGPGQLEGIKGYREAVKKVREKVEEWVKANTAVLSRLLGQGRVKLVVAPGAGVYGGYRFGAPDTEPLGVYRATALVHILRALRDTGAELVVADVTHGVNYMPIALSMAARDAALAWSIASRRRVMVEVVNSEPYPIATPTTELPRLRIHTVETLELDGSSGETVDEAALRMRRLARAARGAPWRYSEGVDRASIGRKIGGIRLGGGSQATLGKTYKLVLGDGIAAANIALYAMPLAALYLAQSTARSWGGASVLGETLNALGRVLEIAVDDGVLDRGRGVAYPAVTLRATSTRLLLFSAAMLDRLKDALGGIVAGDVKVEGASIEDMRDAVEALGSLYRSIALNELSSLQRKCLESKECCSLPVCPGAWPGEPCDDKAVSSVDPRNLKAHAGLERNLVEAARLGETLRLRYRLHGGRPRCWEKLLEQLRKPGF